MNNKTLLKLNDVHVSVEGKKVVKGITFEIKEGEKHTIMGPNGSGKSSLAQALAGHPSYEITKGEVYLNVRFPYCSWASSIRRLSRA